jgi:hypothetical protein
MGSRAQRTAQAVESRSMLERLQISPNLSAETQERLTYYRLVGGSWKHSSTLRRLPTQLPLGQDL